MALTKKTNEETQSTIPVDAIEVVHDEEITSDVPTIQEQTQTLPDYAILNPEIPMTSKVQVATNVANCLKDLVVSQNLVVTGLNPKQPDAEYVTVEGWEVLGTMLGIVPDTKIVEEMKNDKGRTIGFKARATLYQNPQLDDGKIVGGTVLSTAEAYCTKDDFQKKFFSMASMAQTRALGKAYRMALSWIVKMAGFEATYAEDMPNYRGK